MSNVLGEIENILNMLSIPKRTKTDIPLTLYGRVYVLGERLQLYIKKYGKQCLCKANGGSNHSLSCPVYEEN